MNTEKTTENKTKKLFLQRISDGCITVLISIVVLKGYEIYWSSIHTSKENMFALSFDMFSIYYVFAGVFLAFVAPNCIGIILSRKIMRRYTNKNQLPKKLYRALTILVVTMFISICSVTFTDRYSRVEFYNDGNIIEYNRHNEIEKQYNETDIDFIELRTNNSLGKMKTYWTEAIFHINDNEFVLTSKNYITPVDYDINYETEQSLYGLKKIKENFPDKIKINNENIDTLLRVESVNYNENQAQELCEIFEVDYDELIVWLEEEWDIVFESANA